MRREIFYLIQILLKDVVYSSINFIILYLLIPFEKKKKMLIFFFLIYYQFKIFNNFPIFIGILLEK